MIERVAQRVRHRRRPCFELIQRCRVARAETLGHAVRTHRAPLVVIAFEPDLEEILELPVLRDVARREMAVVIENRLRLGELVIEPPRRVSAEQEVVVNEGSWLHGWFCVEAALSEGCAACGCKSVCEVSRRRRWRRHVAFATEPPLQRYGRVTVCTSKLWQLRLRMSCCVNGAAAPVMRTLSSVTSLTGLSGRPTISPAFFVAPLQAMF